MIAAPIDEVHQRQAAAAGLHTFMRLSVAERSGVILMDVLGYSLEEIGNITASSIPAVKAALHRGRERLRAAAAEPDNRPPPTLSPAERGWPLFQQLRERTRLARTGWFRRPPRSAHRLRSQRFGAAANVFYSFVLDGWPNRHDSRFPLCPLYHGSRRDRSRMI